MHAIRLAVRENRLSGSAGVDEGSYSPYVAAGAAWVAETEQGIAGFAAVDAGKREVWALFVAPDAEGKGIGRALELRLLAWAAAQRLERLRLATAPGSRAEFFYRKSGWKEDGRSEGGEILFERELKG